VLKDCSEHDRSKVTAGTWSADMVREHDRIVIEMNESRRGVSERVHCGTVRFAPMIDEPGEAGTSDPRT
jgi:hypothetical protein